MSYVETVDGVIRDELAGGVGGGHEIWNINVGESAVIERGMLLCASAVTAEFAQVTGASDASKVLVVARDDFSADEDHTVTQAFASGKFNRERIKLGGASTLTLDPFEDQLRKSNILLTSIQDQF